jgi:Tfp pilus assembly protein PilZ
VRGPRLHLAERRARPRVRLRVEAAFEDPIGEVFLRTEDLSEGGLRLCGAVATAPGMPVHLVLELPDEPALQRLAGRVVWVARGAPGQMGVAFQPGPGTAAIARTVERRLGSGGVP